MGTSEFAVPILNRLINSQHSIKCVYTKEPKMQSRGMKMHYSPIYKVADKYQIPINTPKTLKNQSEVDILNDLEVDVIVVAAYGLIIPRSILNVCKLGCINVHPSDLPRWRGAAPIQRSMMACDTETAICIMQLDEGVDTGPIFAKKHLKIDVNKNIHQLTEDYAQIGAEMLLETLEGLENGLAKAVPQTDTGATYAQKITSEDERIDWHESATVMHGKIMALSPNAYFVNQGLKIKAVESVLIDQETNELPGTVINKHLDVACGDGKVVRIIKLQRPNAKILQTRDFLCGYKIPIGSIIES